MNIVYSSSDSYAPIAGVSIMSLLHNNTDADEINIYMIDNNISDENKRDLRIWLTNSAEILFLSPSRPQQNGRC